MVAPTASHCASRDRGGDVIGGGVRGLYRIQNRYTEQRYRYRHREIQSKQEDVHACEVIRRLDRAVKYRVV